MYRGSWQRFSGPRENGDEFRHGGPALQLLVVERLQRPAVLRQDGVALLLRVDALAHLLQPLELVRGGRQAEVVPARTPSPARTSPGRQV